MTEPRLPNAKRPPIPKALRAAILARDGAACVYCGATGPQLDLDHVSPWVQGGESEPMNLVVACHVCNLLASDRVFLTGFKAKRDWIRNARSLFTPDELAIIVAQLEAKERA